ncbi:kynurenine aminotransferase-like [Phymastichus coffea]|uniref:kynurenine aminotransferase-like n=1 Tax=Phymastichus coffea TaxID=108790 RepID=UPI00273C22C9|nr:kynurenine aminotransferase-like [Phymastichus coffea]
MSYGTVKLDPRENKVNNLNDEMNNLTIVDLKVDYSDQDIADCLKSALVDASVSKDALMNEYAPYLGVPRFNSAIARFYSKLTNRTLDPKSEVLVTVGASEALFATFSALSSPGDEWILIEPFYAKYEPQIKIAGAIPRFTALKPANSNENGNANNWVLDRNEIRNFINNNTQGIVFNNPNNPLGKSFTDNELKFIAELAISHKLWIISDQAHEFTLDTMTPIASMPGMFERTITIGTASKSFGVPSWRIGWAYGPAEVIRRLTYVQAQIIRSPSTPPQLALAVALEDEICNFNSSDTYLARARAHIKRKRAIMIEACREAGMLPVEPRGGSCLIVSWPGLSGIDLSPVSGRDRGEKFTNWMLENVGINSVSFNIFYGENHKPLGDDYLRFCYNKNDETLRLAAKNLLLLKEYVNNS